MNGPLKTPVSWVGNKTAILPVLYALFPAQYDRYIEPFGGSCAVLLGKDQADKFEVYNDFDHNLVNLFQCLRDRPLAFIRELGFLHLNARDDFLVLKRFFEKESFDDRFLEQELELTSFLLPPLEGQELREVYTAVQRDYDLRRAAMYFKLIRMSYASTRKSFASQPFNLRCLFRLMREVSLRLSNVVIENQDFGKLIEHYDRPGAFFYCDPPYVDTEDMYNGGFRWEDHLRLRQTLGTIQGSFLLSYNDCPDVRELYQGFPFYSFERVHSMVQRYRPGEAYQEILIGNYDLMKCQREQPMQLSLCDMEESSYEK